jgi:hypothetical protein
LAASTTKAHSTSGSIRLVVFGKRLCIPYDVHLLHNSLLDVSRHVICMVADCWLQENLLRQALCSVVVLNCRLLAGTLMMLLISPTNGLWVYICLPAAWSACLAGSMRCLPPAWFPNTVQQVYGYAGAAAMLDLCMHLAVLQLTMPSGFAAILARHMHMWTAGSSASSEVCNSCSSAVMQPAQGALAASRILEDHLYLFGRRLTVLMILC